MKLGAIKDIVATADEPVTITIYQPNGDPYLGADGEESTIDVLGSESKKYRAASRQVQDRMLNRRRGKLTADDVEKNAIFLAASAVTGWSGWEGEDGKPMDCTPENVRLLLEIPHIRTQVDEAIRDHADFSSASSRSS